MVQQVRGRPNRLDFNKVYRYNFSKNSQPFNKIRQYMI